MPDRIVRSPARQRILRSPRADRVVRGVDTSTPWTLGADRMLWLDGPENPTRGLSYHAGRDRIGLRGRVGLGDWDSTAYLPSQVDTYLPGNVSSLGDVAMEGVSSDGGVFNLVWGLPTAPRSLLGQAPFGIRIYDDTRGSDIEPTQTLSRAMNLVHVVAPTAETYVQAFNIEVHNFAQRAQNQTVGLSVGYHQQGPGAGWAGYLYATNRNAQGTISGLEIDIANGTFEEFAYNRNSPVYGPHNKGIWFWLIGANTFGIGFGGPTGGHVDTGIVFLPGSLSRYVMDVQSYTLGGISFLNGGAMGLDAGPTPFGEGPGEGFINLASNRVFFGPTSFSWLRGNADHHLQVWLEGVLKYIATPTALLPGSDGGASLGFGEGDPAGWFRFRRAYLEEALHIGDGQVLGPAVLFDAAEEAGWTDAQRTQALWDAAAAHGFVGTA